MSGEARVLMTPGARAGIAAFFERYGAELYTGDLATTVARHALPLMLCGPQINIVSADASLVRSIVEMIRAGGRKVAAVKAVPTAISVSAQAEGFAFVQVTWVFVRADMSEINRRDLGYAVRQVGDDWVIALIVDFEGTFSTYIGQPVGFPQPVPAGSAAHRTAEIRRFLETYCRAFVVRDFLRMVGSYRLPLIVVEPLDTITIESTAQAPGKVALYRDLFEDQGAVDQELESLDVAVIRGDFAVASVTWRLIGEAGETLGLYPLTYLLVGTGPAMRIAAIITPNAVGDPALGGALVRHPHQGEQAATRAASEPVDTRAAIEEDMRVFFRWIGDMVTEGDTYGLVAANRYPFVVLKADDSDIYPDLPAGRDFVRDRIASFFSAGGLRCHALRVELRSTSPVFIYCNVIWDIVDAEGARVRLLERDYLVHRGARNYRLAAIIDPTSGPVAPPLALTTRH